MQESGSQVLRDAGARRKGDDYVVKMRGLLFILFVVSGVAGTPVRPVAAQSCPSGPLALVLSGGGAKGLAHIGVLRVLDSLGIRPDLIVGASMGSILGAMYASGYTGRQIDSLTRSLTLSDLFRRYEPRAPRSLGARQPLVVWEDGDGGLSLQRAAVRESEVDAILNAAMLRGNLLARGSFDSLPIPLRVVAADLATRESVILDRGDLAQAVRASMSIPLVFTPERMDGRFLGDGSLVDNIPVRTARESGATRVIVSDATEHLADTVNLQNPIVLADQLIGYLVTQPREPLGALDRYVRPKVDGYRSLNFSPERVATLIAAGYQAARVVLADYPCPASPSPKAFRAPSRLGEVRITGGRPSEQEYVLRLLGLSSGDSLDVGAVRSGFRVLGGYDEFRSVWLHPSGSRDTLALNIQVNPGPRRIAALGLAYDNDLGGRMWVGAVDRALLGRRLEGSTSLGLGELRQEVDIGLRTASIGNNRLRPALTGHLVREQIRQFDQEGVQLKPLRTREGIVFTGVEQGLGSRWRVSGGFQFHAWHDPLTSTRSSAGGMVQLSSGTSHPNPALDAEAAVMDRYRRLSVVASTRIHLSRRIVVAPSLRYGWGRNLPLAVTFMLGGYEGFPGLHIGEFRGDREIYSGLSASYRLTGPLLFRIEGAAGRTAQGGPAIPDGRWELGARAGFAAETPIGSMRVEYGRARGGRDGIFVRLGEWF